MTDKRTHLIIKHAARFNSLSNARSYCVGTIKPHTVILGDDGKFWALVMGEAMHLTRRGYEIA